MRKNNLVNKQVIRAIAIGISAVMATSPMTALAAEPGENAGTDDPATQEAEQKSDVERAQDTAAAAEEKCEQTDTAIEDVQDYAENVDAAENSDLAEAIEAVDNIATGVQEETEATAQENTEVSATEDIQSAQEELENAENAEADAENALDDAETAAGEAAAIAAGVVSDEETANNTINTQLGQMKNATTTQEAEKAYQDAQKTAEDAEATYDKAKAAYDEKKKAYDQAITDLAKAKSDYEDAVKNASEDADAAKAKLEEAETAAANLKEEANKAAEAMANDAAIQIAQMEAARAEDKSTQWRKLDTLFESIIRNYYVPVVLNGEVTSYRGYWDSNDEYNVFTVKYKVDGKEETAYLNYKLKNDHDGLVIFEKKWKDDVVLVKAGEAEKYVGTDAEGNEVSYSKDDLDKAVDDGDIVKLVDADGHETYVAKNGEGVTESAGVEIGETAKESYVLDEDGKLVKTVTQDVTTIVYTDKSLSGEGFASEKDALAEAEKALDAEAGKLAEGTELVKGDVETSKTTEYTGTATYISAFTKTIKVNEEANWTYKSANEVAADKRKDVVKDNTDDLWDQGFYVLEDTGSVTAKKTEDRKLLPDDYKVTGEVTLTYAQYKTESVKYSTWDDIKDFFTGNKTEEEIKAALQAKVEAEGGKFIKMDPINWNLKTANFYYVPGQKVTTASTYETAAEAKAAAEKLAGNKAYNVKSSSTAKTTYGYTAKYQEKTTTTDNTVISKTTWAQADTLDYVGATEAQYDGRWVNDNYYNDIIELDEYGDADFRSYIQEATNRKAAYENLAVKAEVAEKAANDAAVEVKNLKKQIEALKNSQASPEELARLNVLTEQLEKAEQNKKDAEDILNIIKKKLADAENDYNEVIRKLTPAPTTPGGTGTGAGTGAGVGAGTDVTTDAGTGVPTVITTQTGATVIVPETAVPLAAAPAFAGNGGAAGQAGDGQAAVADNAVAQENEAAIRTVEDEQTALADKPETTTIEDGETALAATPIGEEKISWWWLLVIAALGATGYEAYKKYRKNKMAKEGNVES